jgi:hypothetical protein
MGEFVRPRVRGYSWEPFKPGHTLTLRHGAWSPRHIDPRARELVDQVAPGVTWWQACDWPAVWAWARTEARCELLIEWLADKGGDLDDDDNVRPAADLLTRLSGQAANMRSRLGLDPLSRFRLGRDVAASRVDLAKLWADDDDEAS